MRKMTAGFYVPTDSFKSIPEHIAVMYEDDQTLVATCGPVDDDPANLAETMRQARLFAHADEILEALQEIASSPETSRDAILLKMIAVQALEKVNL